MAVEGEKSAKARSIYPRAVTQAEKGQTLLSTGAVQVDTRMDAGPKAKRIVHSQPKMKAAGPTGFKK